MVSGDPLPCSCACSVVRITAPRRLVPTGQDIKSQRITGPVRALGLVGGCYRPVRMSVASGSVRACPHTGSGWRAALVVTDRPEPSGYGPNAGYRPRLAGSLRDGPVRLSEGRARSGSLRDGSGPAL